MIEGWDEMAERHKQERKIMIINALFYRDWCLKQAAHDLGIPVTTMRGYTVRYFGGMRKLRKGLKLI